jgi:DNA-binding Lrp family transcriptional regulator
MSRLYSLTEAGRKAWDSQNERVPLDFRRVLGLVGKDTEPGELSRKLGWSEAAIVEILKALEKDRMVKSIGAGSSSSELDFTDSFNVAEIQAAQQRMREALDFTGPLSAEDLRAAQKKR